MNIILLGPPGSGKGTQSERICEKYGIGHISTGDVIRYHIKNQTEFGKYADPIISGGNLVPDEKMIPVLLDEMKKYPKGVLLDGFPRTIPQAEALDGAKVTIDKVLDVEVPDDDIVERITGRVKGEDGKIYHLKFNPPPEGMKYNQRNDDREDVVRERLKVYHTQTKPLIEFYKQKGILVEIDGTKSIDEVFQSILQVLGE